MSGPSVSPAPPAPKVSAPRVAPRASRAAEEELPDQDTLRMLAKLKKKRLGLIKSQPQGTADSAESSDGGASAPGAGRGAGGLPGSGAGIVGEAGPGFPYPWYLKVVSQKMDKEWHVPQGYQPGIICMVGFTLHRDGHAQFNGLLSTLHVAA